MADETTTGPTCLCCAVLMVEGFIADVGHGGFVNVGTWIEGSPEKTFTGSAKTNFRNRFSLQAFRCPECGRVEIFALKSRLMPL